MAIAFLTGIGKILTDLRPFLRLISVFSLVGIVLLGLNNCSLSEQLTEAQQQNSEQLSEIKGLRQVLIDQNESIDRLHQLTEQARVKSEAALKVAEMQNKNINRVITEVKNIKPATCEETAPIVGRAIESLREQ